MVAAPDIIPVLRSCGRESGPLVPGACARESGPLVPRDSVRVWFLFGDGQKFSALSMKECIKYRYTKKG